MNDDVSLPSLLERFARLLATEERLPDASTPVGALTREFHRANWEQARDGILARTDKLIVRPQPGPVPCSFHFELDVAYKKKRGRDAVVELAEGPLTGSIHYRPDIFSAGPGEPSVVVTVDRSTDLLHPNYNREIGALCIGELPPGPFPLEDLLPHLYSILSYQNVSTVDPFDAEAAAWFAQDPDARSGLETVEPLYS